MTTRRSVIAGLPSLATAPIWPMSVRNDLAVGADQALDTVFAEAAPPALAAAITDRTGVIWSGVRGVRRVDGIQPASLSDVWHLGSNTKAMTAALWGRLIDQGRAEWSLPLPDLFPDFTLHPDWSAVTLEEAMGHRAGLLDAPMIDAAWLAAARTDPRSLPDQRTALVARALAEPPQGSRGTLAYGNLNYILAGAAIERVTGQSWEDTMRTEMFGPLGMTKAGFGPVRGDQPWGHRLVGGVLTPIDPTHPSSDNPAAIGPAGTAHMSISDHARFVRLFLTEGGGWIRPETMARLTTPLVVGPSGYALGWATVSDRYWAKGPMIGHEGSNTMNHAYVVAGPVRGLAILVVSNAEPSGGTACQALGAALARLV